jgi:hypothetical protein
MRSVRGQTNASSANMASAFGRSPRLPWRPLYARYSARSRLAVIGRYPPFATVRWGSDEGPLRADTEPTLATVVRLLSRPFLPFGQRPLSAQS